MTTITIKVGKDPSNPHISIDIQGHSGYAPSGQDIVCAGISAIAFTTIEGLKQWAEQFPDYVKIEEV